MGPQDQPDFVNAAVGLLTALAPRELLDGLLAIERRMGRTASERWGPRSSIWISCGWSGRGRRRSRSDPAASRVCLMRNFVLYPLSDIAPTLAFRDMAVSWIWRGGVGMPEFPFWSEKASSVSANVHRFIVIEGPIGVGKTSLARRLSQSFECGQLVLEQAEQNPFLERFYKNPRAAAFQTQLFFLFQRARQMEEVRQQDLFGAVRVADYLLEKDRLFARVTLDDAEYALYERSTSGWSSMRRSPTWWCICRRRSMC
jgi:hypothetical protein